MPNLLFEGENKLNKCMKSISIGLITVMLCTLLPLQVFAQGNDQPSPVVAQKTEPKILYEVVEKRDSNIRQFFKDDMSYEAAVYPEAVNYKENGKWNKIDNTLINITDENNNSVLQNKANSYKVNITNDANSNKLISITKDKYELSWNLQNANKSIPKVAPSDLSARDSLSENEKKLTPVNLSSTVDFTNVFSDIDLQYNVMSEKVKENIILNKNVSNPEFKFELNMKNLVAVVEKDKSITFIDDKDATKEIYKITPPVMFDTKGNQSKDIELTLEKSSTGYVLTLKPSSIWLDSPDRVYPVTVDPCVQTNCNNESGDEGSIRQSDPSESLTSFIGVQSGDDTLRGYSKVRNLPELTSADYVTKASFNLGCYSVTGGTTVGIHQITSSWTNMTWNNQPSYVPEAEDFVKSTEPDGDNVQYTATSGPQYTWDVTKTVKEWYNDGNNNYGFMLDAIGVGSASFATTYMATEAGYISPSLIIDYVNNSGLENYWTYHSQDVGRAGIGYVNDSNGNMTFIHNDISETGNLMPLKLQHVYNSNCQNEDIGYGLGWRSI